MRALLRKRRTWPLRLRLLTLLTAMCAGTTCLAGERGPFGIDYLVTYDDSGIWKRSYQQSLYYGLIAAEVGGALWYGGESRLGQTFWRSIDSSVAAGIVSQVLKVSFSRVRPI